jgi:hypothetical protein
MSQNNELTGQNLEDKKGEGWISIHWSQGNCEWTAGTKWTSARLIRVTGYEIVEMKMRSAERGRKGKTGDEKSRLQ